jgi:putative polyhydroxyalkanoate system protein
MAKFSVNKTFTMSKEEVREAAEQLAEQLKADHGLKYYWQGDSVKFSRSGIDGVLKIEADAIRLDVKLGLLASAFERPLKKAMNEYLDKYVS